MSLPFDGFKAAQTGLVDMGNISFYDTGATPVFNPFELAQYATSFSEIVLNVTWAQLQTSQNSLDTSFIDSAIQQVNEFNSTYHTDLGIKLRVWGGFTAPIWVKEINGGALITVTGQNAVDPGSYAQPDDRPLLDRRLHQRLAEPAERARHQVRRHGDHPRHLADGRSLRHRRALRADAHERGRVVQPRRRHGEPDRPAADGRLQRRRRDADAARGDRRLLPMVDDAARLHDEQLPPVRQRQRAARRQLHAGRPAAGAELGPHRPGRQSCPARSALFARRCRLWPARQRRHGQARVGQQQLPDRGPDHPGGLSRLAGRDQPGRPVECRQHRAVGLPDQCRRAQRLPELHACPAAGPGLDPRRRQPAADHRRARTTARCSASSRRRPSAARPARSPSPAPMPCCSPAIRRPRPTASRSPRSAAARWASTVSAISSARPAARRSTSTARCRW